MLTMESQEVFFSYAYFISYSLIWLEKAQQLWDPCKDAISLPGLIRAEEEMAILFSVVLVWIHWHVLHFDRMWPARKGPASTVMAISKSEFWSNVQQIMLAESLPKKRQIVPA